MEVQNHLGIYVGKDRATVVCLGGEDALVAGCFSVSAAGQTEGVYAALADLIAQGCSERGWQWDEAAVAVDCSMYMQHTIASEFSDRRQIGSTIRFDTEEAMATDISNVALAWQVLSTNEHGAQVGVFSADQDPLRSIIVALQRNGMDPTSIEPDICCLSRFLRNRTADQASDGRTLYAFLSRNRGYMVLSPPDGQTDAPVTGRTFLIASSQDRRQVLSRELMVTTAAVETSAPVTKAQMLDVTGQADSGTAASATAMDITDFDPGLTPEECTETVEFLIATGAALSLATKNEVIDFRADFMPYLGRRRRVEHALQFASISVTVMIIAIGLYFSSQWFITHRYRSMLRDKFSNDYAAVMNSKGLPRGQNPVRRLENALTEVKIKTSGTGRIEGDESITGKLASVMEAMNKCASATDLNIDTVTITGRSMSISGDTRASQNRNTLRFFKEIKDTGLRILTQRLGSKGDRDSFSITLEVESAK